MLKKKPNKKDKNIGNNGQAAADAGQESVVAGSVAKDQVDLTRLKKKELLEIMLRQGEEIDRLRAQVKELESKLLARELEFSKLGSIAEASLAVTNIFKEADEAARLYLENVRRRIDETQERRSSDN